jgi:hypothetical protein
VNTTVRDYKALVVCCWTANIKYSGNAAKENKNQKNFHINYFSLKGALLTKTFFSLRTVNIESYGGKLSSRTPTRIF